MSQCDKCASFNSDTSWACSLDRKQCEAGSSGMSPSQSSGQSHQQHAVGLLFCCPLFRTVAGGLQVWCCLHCRPIVDPAAKFPSRMTVYTAHTDPPLLLLGWPSEKWWPVARQHCIALHSLTPPEKQISRASDFTRLFGFVSVCVVRCSVESSNAGGLVKKEDWDELKSHICLQGNRNTSPESDILPAECQKENVVRGNNQEHWFILIGVIFHIF